MTVDPRNFLLNTDYEMDKIIYYNSGSITVSSIVETKTFAHNLGFTPLVFGVCSQNSDFSESHTFPYLLQTQSDYLSFEVKADSSNIVVTYYDYNNSSTMYYRIYAFEPSDSQHTVVPTASNAKKFILNTDYNYCKLFKKGIISNTVGTHTVSHNLGYIPQVLVWGEKSGYTAPIENSKPQDPVFNEPAYISVNNSNITIRDNDGQNPSVIGQTWDKVHYRIYYDEG